MRGAGIEPAFGCPKGILSPPRLPFRHPRVIGTTASRTAGILKRSADGKFGSAPPLSSPVSRLPSAVKAGNGTRTRDPNLGKVVLYQLSYSRDARSIAVARCCQQLPTRQPRAHQAWRARSRRQPPIVATRIGRAPSPIRISRPERHHAVTLATFAPRGPISPRRRPRRRPRSREAPARHQSRSRTPPIPHR